MVRVAVCNQSIMALYKSIDDTDDNAFNVFIDF